MLTVLPEG